MKRTWVLVTVLLATVGGPATAAIAKPISTYSLNAEIPGGAGEWRGDIYLEVDEQGLGYLRVMLTRSSYVTCSNGETSMDIENISYDNSTGGLLNVERKLASLEFASIQGMTWSTFDGCAGSSSTPSADTTFSVLTTATGDLSRGRNAQGRLLSRVSDASISIGGLDFTDSVVLTELITKG